MLKPTSNIFQIAKFTALGLSALMALTTFSLGLGMVFTIPLLTTFGTALFVGSVLSTASFAGAMFGAAALFTTVALGLVVSLPMGPTKPKERKKPSTGAAPLLSKEEDDKQQGAKDPLLQNGSVRSSTGQMMAGELPSADEQAPSEEAGAPVNDLLSEPVAENPQLFRTLDREELMGIYNLQILLRENLFKFALDGDLSKIITTLIKTTLPAILSAKGYTQEQAELLHKLKESENSENSDFKEFLEENKMNLPGYLSTQEAPIAEPS